MLFLKIVWKAETSTDGDLKKKQKMNLNYDDHQATTTSKLRKEAIQFKGMANNVLLLGSNIS